VKRVLIADDDPVVLSVYREGLSKLGLEVDTVEDGLAALKALQRAKPDILVLDLVMPKLSGVDVLKFIRSSATLKNLPVIILSNSYAQEVAREAAAVGAQKGLLKISCNPLLLAGVIGEIIDGQCAADAEAHLLGVVATAPLSRAEALPAPRPVSKPASPSSAPPARPAPVLAPACPQAIDAEAVARARMDFLEKANRICSGSRSLCDSIVDTTAARDCDARLQDLGRRFEFLTASAEMVGCIRIARMANAIQALLLGMADKPGRITSSALHTAADAIDFISHLVQNAGAAPESPLTSSEVIAVDDDQLSNRLVVSSLRAVQIKARSESDPLAALRLLASKYYNLVLLDVEMPGMDGVDFCRRLRLLPGYETTPVIFVTLHGDPDTRARAIQSGGDDLIVKPIMPLELAVKVLMHLLNRES